MTRGVTVGWCGRCNGGVVAQGEHYATCPCGQTWWTITGAPGATGVVPPARPNLRLVKDEDYGDAG